MSRAVLCAPISHDYFWIWNAFPLTSVLFFYSDGPGLFDFTQVSHFVLVVLPSGAVPPRTRKGAPDYRPSDAV